MLRVSAWVACVAALWLAPGCASPKAAKEQPARPSDAYRREPRAYGTTMRPRPTGTASTRTAPATGRTTAAPSLQASAPTVALRQEGTAYLLKAGDALAVYLRGIPREEMIEDVVDEDGFISLPYLNRVQAAGRTASELERVIRNIYLDQRIYKDVTVNIMLPAQSYYVRGEVRGAGRYPLVSGVTIVQAIASAGGYTEFANPRKVKLLRGGKPIVLDVPALERFPERDMPVEAGDVIVVPRSMF